MKRLSSFIGLLLLNACVDAPVEEVSNQQQRECGFMDCIRDVAARHDAEVAQWKQDHPILAGLSEPGNGAPVASHSYVYDDKGRSVGTYTFNPDGSGSYFGRDGAVISTP